ncbi:SAUR-like auxin-responsive protein family [Artemisia annua]|uniref:SAUR-like auxin-responsive protein family n=1 Tax=Artemisia annua TaxID=35608 RepID=A0A2U1P286_ARTAN|nr:SAUR-like auxin-responsive protein family [Artemisia annua]
MKKLIRCLSRHLSRVTDSSEYSLLQREERAIPAITKSSAVPRGHLPVYVGEDMQRFVVKANLLKHPVFINLLYKSAQEYGYEQQGVLRIHCQVVVFEQVLEALRAGKETFYDFHDLVSDEVCSSLGG